MLASCRALAVSTQHGPRLSALSPSTSVMERRTAGLRLPCSASAIWSCTLWPIGSAMVGQVLVPVVPPSAASVSLPCMVALCPRVPGRIAAIPLHASLAPALSLSLPIRRPKNRSLHCVEFTPFLHRERLLSGALRRSSPDQGERYFRHCLGCTINRLHTNHILLSYSRIFRLTSYAQVRAIVALNTIKGVARIWYTKTRRTM